MSCSGGHRRTSLFFIETSPRAGLMTHKISEKFQFTLWLQFMSERLHLDETNFCYLRRAWFSPTSRFYGTTGAWWDKDSANRYHCFADRKNEVRHHQRRTYTVWARTCDQWRYYSNSSVRLSGGLESGGMLVFRLDRRHEHRDEQDLWMQLVFDRVWTRTI